MVYIWVFSNIADAAVSSSLIIQQQLRDKEKAHDYLISFLKKLDLWDRVGFCTLLGCNGGFLLL